ncbi:hypothetical protein PGT21_005306 [Puccinia graminis f. sp. tritici]|uniref:Uncharacterized protein n=1 Tax=Puccinia graminis f. sp. tritici TaxID=56615 RepID=A0A5B0ME82_PUCGR|nr:hypothetical protein PGT21_005306 [Puccinia graminis f. sp. tritici]
MSVQIVAHYVSSKRLDIVSMNIWKDWGNQYMDVPPQDAQAQHTYSGGKPAQIVLLLRSFSLEAKVAYFIQ